MDVQTLESLTELFGRFGRLAFTINPFGLIAAEMQSGETHVPVTEIVERFGP